MELLNTAKRKFFWTSAIAALMLFISGNIELPAQQDNGPTGYCNPAEDYRGTVTYYHPSGRWCYPKYYPENYTYYNWYYANAIEEVEIYNAAETKMLRESPGKKTDAFEDCYVWTGEEAELLSGETYTIRGKCWHSYYSLFGNNYCGRYPYTWYNYMYYTYRIFIDWNMDGDFDDPGEWINQTEDNAVGNNPGNSWRAYLHCDEYHTWQYSVTIPGDIPIGKTRMRVMTCYNYPYNYSWANPKPEDACWNGYMYEYTWYNPPRIYAYSYGEIEDYLLNFSIPFKNTFPSDKAPDNVLRAGEWYNGETRYIEEEEKEIEFKRPMVELGGPQPEGAMMKYKIIGPLPSTKIVYRALDVVTGSEKINIDVNSPNVTNDKFIYIDKSMGEFTDGNGFIKFPKGGEYELNLEYYKSPNADPKVAKKKFTVSWPYDLSVQSIESPKTNGFPYFKKYVRGLTIPLEAKVMNTGLNNVYRFRYTAKIYTSDGQLKDEFTNIWDTSNLDQYVVQPLQTVTLEFGNIKYTQPDVYTMVVTVTMLSAEDDEEYNDRYARQGEEQYTFAVQDEIQAASIDIITPNQNDTIYAGRPFIPVGEFENRGVGDISNAQATISFKKLPDGEISSYTSTVQDIPSGRYNKKSHRFEPITIEDEGEYRITLKVNASGDLISEDDQISETFYVVKGLEGNIFVGKGHKYETIQEFTNDVFLKGMTGSINVYLTDKHYELHAKFNDEPAWNLSSTINGLGYDEETGEINTLTFMPADERASERGGVTIDLYSGNGKGVFIGQADGPVNENAIINRNFGADYLRKFSNFGGYVTFDGGNNKALKFNLYSQTKEHGAVFYLNRGSENITIKNILMENKEPLLKDRIWLPRTTFNTVDGFEFQKDIKIDVQQGVDSYSAGVIHRSTLFGGAQQFEVEDDIGMVDEISIKLDTIPNTNIIIENNEISGFGYGIVSLGIGVLINEQTSLYQEFYNANNKINYNKMYDLGGGGIVIGHETGLEVRQNEIWNVNSNDEASGIVIGLQGDKSNDGRDLLGYNNYDVNVTGNKIHNIIADNRVNGIKFIQNANKYISLVDEGFETFPQENDQINIKNNAIWWLKGNKADALRAGIHAYSGRDPEVADPLMRLLTPKHSDYRIRSSSIVNNTIIINDDGLTNTGLTAGIGVQQADNMIVKNNAIAIADPDISANSEVAAGLFIQGVMPQKGSITSDYNAFNLSPVSTVARYVQTDEDAEIVSLGDRNEYNSLLQWQMWTGNDINSADSENFLNDMIMSDKMLKMKPNNQLLGSILSDRGEILSYVEYDVNGKERGAAGENYDIGAFEFDGLMYNRDLQVMTITSPGVYRETEAGPVDFSDAEYVMTRSPIEVKARLRNNSSTDIVKSKVNLKIYQEMPDGSWMEYLHEDKLVSIPSTSNLDVYFDLADGLGKDFSPKTYGDYLGGYNVPNQFTGMKYNVTPRYRIEVSVGSDENVDNNVFEKTVRYYIHRSNIDMMMTAKKYVEDASGSQDDLASYLNLNAMTDAMKNMGWYNDHSLGLTIDVYETIVSDNAEIRDTRDGEMLPMSLGQLEPNMKVIAEYTMVENEYHVSKVEVVDELVEDPLRITGEIKKITMPKHDIDIFYRAGWYGRVTDYDHYRTLMWSDGNDDILNRYQGEQIASFMGSGDVYSKHNFVAGSEEVIRNNDPGYTAKYLRATSRFPHTPLGSSDNNYSGNKVTGVSVARNVEFNILETEVSGDAYPEPALMNIESQGQGIARIAYVYNKVENDENQEIPESARIMGVAATTLSKNAVILGVDWRHFENLDYVLRGVFDFIRNNGGEVVPIELLTFDAEQTGNRVTLNWQTASEKGSDKFEVERAGITDAGEGEFIRITEVNAAGNSSIVKDYGPVVDENVMIGNTYAYRLKMVDVDGEFEYSNTEVVSLEGEGLSLIEEPVPNPVKTTATLKYGITGSGEVKLNIYDINGNVVKTIPLGVQGSGYHELQIDAADMSSGSYKLVLQSGKTMLSTTMNVVK